MRRIILLLTVCMLLPVFAAVQADEVKIVVCEEQGFSTLCDDKYTYDYHPGEGISVYENSPENEPYLLIFRTDSDTFDAETYFRDEFTPQVEADYGSSLIEAGEFMDYDIAGITLAGQMCIYDTDGVTKGRLCLVDVRPDSYIRYETFFSGDQVDEAVGMLTMAAACYQPDPWYYSETEDTPGVVL